MARLQSYNPVGLTQSDDVKEILIKNLNAISVSIKTSQSEILGNDQKISANSNSIVSNSNSIASIKETITTNEGRSSLTYHFGISDVTPPLSDPITGSISIDVSGDNLLVNKTPNAGGTTLDLSEVVSVEIFGNETLNSTFKDAQTIVDSGSFYNITFDSTISTGTFSLSDIAMVTFHW